MNAACRISLAVFLTPGCSSQRAQPAADSPSAAVAPAASVAEGREADPAKWTVSPAGFGPLRAGMTLTAARSLLGDLLRTPPAADTAGCIYVTLANGPSGVQLMLERGVIARIDVTAPPVATEEGALVGTSEAHVQQLYSNRVTRLPHKYAEGSYLIVRAPAPADSADRIVFETDGRIVTRYRAGRVPAVEYVESCG